MATSAQITSLRKLTGVTVAEWSDVDLNALLDDPTTLGSTNVAAAHIWRSVAASAAALVDVEESGSKRSMSQTYKNALEMAKTFDSLAASEGVIETPGVADVPATRVRSITRS